MTLYRYIGEHPDTTFTKDGKTATFEYGKPTECPSWLRLERHVDFEMVEQGESVSEVEPPKRRGRPPKASNDAA